MGKQSRTWPRRPSPGDTVMAITPPLLLHLVDKPGDGRPEGGHGSRKAIVGP